MKRTLARIKPRNLADIPSVPVDLDAALAGGELVEVLAVVPDGGMAVGFVQTIGGAILSYVERGETYSVDGAMYNTGRFS